MPVLGLNHINIRTPDYAETVAFLQTVLGMRVTTIPGLDSTDKAAWVCDASGAPIFHLASADVPYSPQEELPKPAPRGSGAIHHLALTCSDYVAMKQRLETSNTQYRENTPAQGVKQLFVQDPSGITFELNFQES